MSLPAVVIESIGWLATAVVVASFFFDNAVTLRCVQILGSVLWMLYGMVIGSLPVIVANVLVFAAASWSVSRMRRVLAADDTVARA